MKRFVYLILISISSFLTLLNAKNYSEEYSDLIRILFLEKSAFEEFSFSPFPLIALKPLKSESITTLITAPFANWFADQPSADC